ncbi:hypothetical protein AXF42_Ash013279 [Apostasia shenzhenica]|uniref:Uncharacterized protein n=1 Tax=Apostasia shenzhenica TaxID=1088818 RepID=A0A2I0BBH9_9ASPA|nr:hypothetical protein AXF42_Ash013279 [Apostasia shenzhenica]
METETGELAGSLDLVPKSAVLIGALQTSMVDYIIGVADPLEWHSKVQLGKEQAPLLEVDVFYHGSFAYSVFYASNNLALFVA